ncbi:MAG: hypothetical protein WC115_04920, partial [Sphaerochaeta sp.]
QCIFGSFASFIKAMLDSDLSATDQAFVFEDPSLGRLEGGWDASLEVQGQTIKYNNFDPVGTNLWYVER